MLKAINIQDNSDIVIFDNKWAHAINLLREFDHQDLLVCPVCLQPVRVRAGQFRTKHFAHKHLGNCDFAAESPELREARKVLYEWLVSKFGEDVTIEKRVNGIDLVRPIDCWVTQGTSIFAYWIFDKPLKPEKREILQSCIGKLKVNINWIFTNGMLRTETNDPEQIILTTTEREFIRHSKYDLPDNPYRSFGSLHYLNTENRELSTFRCLSLYHEPQVYKGKNKTDSLDHILVSPQNGEFVFSGEHAELKEYQENLKAKISSQPGRRRESATFPQRTGPSHIVFGDEQTNNGFWSGRLEQQKEKDNVPPESSEAQLAVCIICGKETRDWWYFDGKGKCKCNACKKQGRF